jgi:hypothetical protein
MKVLFKRTLLWQPLSVKNPAKAMDFLRAIKISSTPSSWMGSKAGRSHVVRFYGM